MPREKAWTLVRKNQFKRQPIGKKSVRKMRKRFDREEFPIVDPHSPHGTNKNFSTKTIKKALLAEAEKMRDAEFLPQFIAYIHTIIHEQIQALPQSENEITLYLRSYGIGNFSTSPSARKQMALFLAIRDYFNDVVFIDPNMENDAKQSDADASEAPAQPYVFSWQKNSAMATQRKTLKLDLAELYDPVFTPHEIKVLEALNMNVPSSNDEALVAVSEEPCSSFLVCYMPHCPRTLYNNLLSVNFSRQQLCRVIVIGNSFQEYGNLAAGPRPDATSLSYILRLLKLNLITEQDVSRWLPNVAEKSRRRKKKAPTPVLTMDAEKDIQVEHDAFAFQHIHHCPVRHLMRIPADEWESIAQELFHEQMIPTEMDVDMDEDMVLGDDIALED